MRDLRQAPALWLGAGSKRAAFRGVRVPMDNVLSCRVPRPVTKERQLLTRWTFTAAAGFACKASARTFRALNASAASSAAASKRSRPPVSPIRELAELLRNLEPVLQPGVCVVASVAPGGDVTALESLATFREAFRRGAEAVADYRAPRVGRSGPRADGQTPPPARGRCRRKSERRARAARRRSRSRAGWCRWARGC
jgi:hypothetical protein